MDAETLHAASRLTAAMLPHMELDKNGETAAAEAAALYWTVVNQLVQQRRQKEGSTVPRLRE